MLCTFLTFKSENDSRFQTSKIIKAHISDLFSATMLYIAVVLFPMMVVCPVVKANTSFVGGIKDGDGNLLQSYIVVIVIRSIGRWGGGLNTKTIVQL